MYETNVLKALRAVYTDNRSVLEKKYSTAEIFIETYIPSKKRLKKSPKDLCSAVTASGEQCSKRFGNELFDDEGNKLCYHHHKSYSKNGFHKNGILSSQEIIEKLNEYNYQKEEEVEAKKLKKRQRKNELGKKIKKKIGLNKKSNQKSIPKVVISNTTDFSTYVSTMGVGSLCLGGDDSDSD